jgi:hypothetical protein
MPRDREGILQAVAVVMEDFRVAAAVRTGAREPTAGLKMPCSAASIRAMAVMEA